MGIIMGKSNATGTSYGIGKVVRECIRLTEQKCLRLFTEYLLKKAFFSYDSHWRGMSKRTLI